MGDVQHREGGSFGSGKGAYIPFPGDSLEGLWGLQGPDEERSIQSFRV